MDRANVQSEGAARESAILGYHELLALEIDGPLTAAQHAYAAGPPAFVQQATGHGAGATLAVAGEAFGMVASATLQRKRLWAVPYAVHGAGNTRVLEVACAAELEEAARSKSAGGMRRLRIAVARANATAYGLAAGILTGDPDRGLAVADRLQAGIVHVNDQPVGDEPQMPFGGVKDSGWGRFGGQAAIDEFTELKWVTVQSGTRPFPF